MDRQQHLCRDVAEVVQRRAAVAATTNDVVDAVFCALIESDIDQWNVTVDDWKHILSTAFQAARQARAQLAA
ncbi:MAG: hypothetical protein QGG36_27305 [Pirellulaceae bacterium]|jgi:hypothetical protein|nr:hypothetical protein [Pirellulaceae bacterium]MDP7019535.1 hypothetical protein [Pirellulaceae bacterium]